MRVDATSTSGATTETSSAMEFVGLGATTTGSATVTGSAAEVTSPCRQSAITSSAKHVWQAATMSSSDRKHSSRDALANSRGTVNKVEIEEYLHAVLVHRVAPPDQIPG